MCGDEIVQYSVCDGWPNGDGGSRKLQRLAHSCRRGTKLSSSLEIGIKDTDEQSLQACTASAVEQSASDVSVR